MYTITKRFAFSASHIIGGLPNGHPCARLHGHNYEVEVVLQACVAMAEAHRPRRELTNGDRFGTTNCSN